MANEVPSVILIRDNANACHDAMNFVLEKQQFSEVYLNDEYTDCGVYYSRIDGICRWNIDTGILYDCSEKFSCEVESFSADEANGCFIHYLCSKGTILIDDEIEWEEDPDEEELEFNSFFSKLILRDRTIDPIDVLNKESSKENRKDDSDNEEYSVSSDEEFIIENSAVIGYKGTANIIKIPASVTTIGWNAFEENKNIIKVFIPESVVEIQGYAFGGCKNLSEVVFSNSKANIDNTAFYGCKGLRKGDYRIAGNYLVEYCGKEKSVVVPEGIEIIGEDAFTASKIIEVTLPSTLKAIDNCAFLDCARLNTVHMPLVDDLIIRGGPFQECYKLADKNGMVIINGILFDYFGEEEEITIPYGVTRTADAIEAESVTRILIPKTLKDIGERAFRKAERVIYEKAENV